MLPDFLQLFLVDGLVDLLVLEDVGDAFVDFLVVRAALGWLAMLRIRVDRDR